MDVDELKLRRLANHHLCAPTDADTVLRDSCGLQCQFLSNALHALRIRCLDFDSFDREVLIKTWALRGTMHLLHREDLPLLLHTGRSHFLRPKDTLESDPLVSKERKAFFAGLVTEAVENGTVSREDLKSLCAAHGMTDTEANSLFDPWGGLIRALCENGTLCHRVQEKKAYRLCPSFKPMEGRAAKSELARRYFTHYGPSTIKDAAYFFCVTHKEVKSWLEQLPVTTEECAGKTYFSLPCQSSVQTVPDCLFLAGFDPMLMGYEKTDNPFLPLEHLRKIFNMAGIVMPAVLLRGRIVGKWKRSGKKLLITLFEPIADPAPIHLTAKILWPAVNICIQN